MERIDRFLLKRKDSNLLRKLRPADSRFDGRIVFNEKEYIDFSSNDYLSLSNHLFLKEASKAAVDNLGTGSAASRLLSGNLNLHHKLEDAVAVFKQKEHALVFNSGYQANLGIIGSLYTKRDAIFSDKLSHASIIDGIFLSEAKSFRFRHNDTGHLESLLKKERGRSEEALIVTESIFSMDGDRPPLKELIALKKKYDCKIMVDEAHATGIFGPTGSGIVEDEGLTGEVDLIMGTFGKALGGFGAYIASSGKIIEYIINFCRSFIYSTALPPPVIAAGLAAIETVRREPFRRKRLLENAAYFRGLLNGAGFKTRGDSQIVPVIIGSNEKAVAYSKALCARGYWVLPIRPPTVPVGEARLRFSLTYEHTKDILDNLINDMRGICKI